MTLSARLTRVMVCTACALRNRNAFAYCETVRQRVLLPNLPVACVEHYGQRGEDVIVAALIAARAASEDVDTATLRYLEIGGITHSPPSCCRRVWG